MSAGSRGTRTWLAALHAAVAVCGAAIGTAVSGCQPSPSEFFYEDDFESLCAGAPCGWVVGAGPVGSALAVETLPGEHGIALFGDRVAVLGPVEGIEADTGLDASRLAAFVAARCDAGADLELEVSVADLATGAIHSYRGTIVPASVWTAGMSTTALLRVGGTTSSVFFRDVVAIRILKAGPGVCEIDALGLSSTFLRF